MLLVLVLALVGCARAAGAQNGQRTLLPVVLQNAPAGGGSQIIIGGSFARVNGAARRGLARLNDDGTLDAGFVPALPTAPGVVRALTVQSNGAMVAAVSSVPPDGLTPGYVVRLDAGGAIDGGFRRTDLDAYGAAYDVALQPDGKAVIGGFFYLVDGEERGGVARLSTLGGLDPASRHGVPGARGIVYALALQPDDKVVVVGFFDAVTGVARGNAARLNADGTLDRTFLEGLPGADRHVWSVAVQPDGRVLIGGDFGAVNGEPRGRLARLNADGTLDRTFLEGLPGANGTVSAIAVQPDGKVLIGGSFTRVNGVTRRSLARLNADGTPDSGFLSGLAGPDGNVVTLARQPDGRLLIGGDFATVNGVARSGLARLLRSGALDTDFLAGLSGPDGPVAEVALVPVATDPAIQGIAGAGRAAGRR